MLVCMYVSVNVCACVSFQKEIHDVHIYLLYVDNTDSNIPAHRQK